MSAAFELERFVVVDGRLELAGCWRADPQRRYRRVRLLVETAAHIRRLAPLTAATVHATPEGEPWTVAFRWAGDPERITRVELEVGRDLAVALPRPGVGEPEPDAPARSEPVGPSALAFRAEILELNARLEAAREEARQRREEAAEATGALEKARADAAEARQEARGLREKVESLEGDLAKLTAEGESMRGDRDALREELRRVREEAARPAAEPTTETAPLPVRSSASGASHRHPPAGERPSHAGHQHHHGAGHHAHTPQHHPPHREPRPHDLLTLRVATIALAVPVVVALVVIVESLS